MRVSSLPNPASSECLSSSIAGDKFGLRHYCFCRPTHRWHRHGIVCSTPFLLTISSPVIARRQRRMARRDVAPHLAFLLAAMKTPDSTSRHYLLRFALNCFFFLFQAQSLACGLPKAGIVLLLLVFSKTSFNDTLCRTPLFFRFLFILVPVSLCGYSYIYIVCVCVIDYQSAGVINARSST